jgi:hypothetical protein
LHFVLNELAIQQLFNPPGPHTPDWVRCRPIVSTSKLNLLVPSNGQPHGFARNHMNTLTIGITKTIDAEVSKTSKLDAHRQTTPGSVPNQDQLGHETVSFAKLVLTGGGQ